MTSSHMAEALEVEVEVVLNSKNVGWFKEKGYKLPKIERSYPNRGSSALSTTTKKIIPPTKLWVRVKDLQPLSNVRVSVPCPGCGELRTVPWSRISNNLGTVCQYCHRTNRANKTAHWYWQKKLISNNSSAKCDISGVFDKRFLELHHLLARSAGGKNELLNYVILSANYHRAFHRQFGGTTGKCTPEQYYQFKAQELKRIHEEAL